MCASKPFLLNNKASMNAKGKGLKAHLKETYGNGYNFMYKKPTFFI